MNLRMRQKSLCPFIKFVGRSIYKFREVWFKGYDARPHLCFTAVETLDVQRDLLKLVIQNGTIF